ncbi:TauD/TfdA dioxygenase family protein [Pigmentiphaga kullae]|uniref:Taurine dioxygenase n=1 Tax=Pigmentiphaga kullae TaxID=151784 RepID=A0A4Q7NKU3_9BURK|nr:TauD/TfdA family dioxygenase [Pigmentiphaga kullae]RZS85562.1 taurine dioxygenase [Pigmentiphaga kullae]
MLIRPLTPAIGSEVLDIDLADAAEVTRHADRLRALLAERQVIFFREQRLSPDAQVFFSQVFGNVEPVSSTFPSHPANPYVEMLVTRGKETGTDIWHADLTWQPRPPVAACLYAVEVPEVGGDTMWASMTAAHDSLDEGLRRYLAGMTAVHHWEAPALVNNLKGKPDGDEQYHAMRRRYPPVDQPVFLPHPATGRRVVFVNSLYTTRINQMGHDDGAHMLSFLAGLARVPEWQVRFNWRKGSVAVWDNLATQHYAVNDYYPSPRTMHRVSIR